MMMDNKKIRIVIIDDIVDICNYFKMVLERESGMEVVAVGYSGKEAYHLAMEHNPDVMLMDVQMETELAGIDALRKIKKERPDIKVIVLTIHGEDDILFEAYAAGAVNFLIKDSSIAEIVNTIKSAYNNELTLSSDVANKIVSEFSRMKNNENSLIFTLNLVSKLTKSEFEILRALYLGKSYIDIAKERFVEEVTIRTQVHKILKKFGIKSMKDLIETLRRLKIFEIYKNVD